MPRRLRFSGLVGIGYICFVFILLNQRYGDLLKYRIEPTMTGSGSREISDDTQEPNLSNDFPNAVQRAINLQREIIRDEMMDYQYPNRKYNQTAAKLDDLVIENNGRPIRSIILTTWRSGSTFLSDVLAAHPASFNYYEPFSHFRYIRIRGPPLAKEALKTIKSLFNCDYTDLGEQLEYRKQRWWLFKRDLPMWNQCLQDVEKNYGPALLSGMCKLFPFQTMKLTRLRLSVAQELLADKELAVRILMLIRDPRGILQSRKHYVYCENSPDCLDPAIVCGDLVSDHAVALKMQKKYPTTFRVIRFEDLAVDPYKYTEEISKFYGINFHPNMRSFLDSHIVRDVVVPFSTYRKSRAVPFHWRNDFSFGEVEKIQRVCLKAMKRWGYVPAMNETHQRIFNPVTKSTGIRFL